MSDPNQPPPPPGGQPPAAPPPGPPGGTPPPAGPPPGGGPPPPGGMPPGGGYNPPPAQAYGGGGHGGGGAVPGGTPLSEPWKRIVAFLLDSIGLFIIIGIPVSIVVGGSFNSFTTIGESFLRSFLAGILTAVIYFLYYALLIASRGQTVAGMVLGIKVVNTSGAAVTMEQAFKRQAWTLLSLVPCIGGLAQLAVAIWGLVNLFNDPMRQTPWDKLGETIVVDA